MQFAFGAEIYYSADPLNETLNIHEMILEYLQHMIQSSRVNNRIICTGYL